MTEDSILIRAERLILWGSASWQVRLAEPTSQTGLELVLEYTQDDHSVVSRDSKFRVLLLA